ncbi:MAG TPA: Na+/H+ antiporter subunit D [Sandaracinaceae bacterium LLY-WYZ-13_1]|nr:Na+/H+ antiporter subunit D [Sandaracinaceae bacterium LLY-WYZ-13_1]
MNALVVIPVALPLVAAAAGFLFHRWPRIQERIALGASVALAGASCALLWVVRREGLLVTRLGAWPMPHGVVFVADLLSALLVCAVALLGLAVVIYASASVGKRRRAFGLHPLVQVLLAGACGVLLTADLFNLFVWFEVMLIASFVLLALGGTPSQLAGATKYVTLNLLASTFLLCGIGLVYGLTGTLSYADLARTLSSTRPDGPFSAAAFLLMAALAIKSAAFPFFFWLPASYHTPPPAMAALFAGLLTKVGVYAMIRCATMLFPEELQRASVLVAFVAGATMLTGVLGAAAQKDMRRILSFHIVSQIGYMLMGVAIWGVRGLGGAVFFLLHNMAAKPALFLSVGVVEHDRGSSALHTLGGLARQRPVASLLFLVPALSLAGLPPLSGFAGKLVLVRAGLDGGLWLVTSVALAVSLLTLYSMIKIWLKAFWSPDPRGDDAPPPRDTPRRMIAPLAAVAAATVALGVLAEPVAALCFDAAAQLLDREAYAQAVFAAGEGR